jgi:hypothetical protein
MPRISQWGVEVDVDIDIDVADFYGDCSDREKKELAGYLIEDHFIPGQTEQVGEDNLMDVTYKEALNKLYSKRIYLTLEEEQFIINLANKY